MVNFWTPAGQAHAEALADAEARRVHDAPDPDPWDGYESPHGSQAEADAAENLELWGPEGPPDAAQWAAEQATYLEPDSGP